MKQTIEIEIPDGKKAVWKNGPRLFIGTNQDAPQHYRYWED